jgi:hypothetical protein
MLCSGATLRIAGAERGATALRACTAAGLPAPVDKRTAAAIAANGPATRAAHTSNSYLNGFVLHLCLAAKTPLSRG